MTAPALADVELMVGAALPKITLDEVSETLKAGVPTLTVSVSAAVLAVKFVVAAWVAVIVVVPLPIVVIVEPEIVATLVSLET